MSPIKCKDRNREVTWGEWLYGIWRDAVAQAEYNPHLAEYDQLSVEQWKGWEALGATVEKQNRSDVAPQPVPYIETNSALMSQVEVLQSTVVNQKRSIETLNHALEVERARSAKVESVRYEITPPKPKPIRLSVVDRFLRDVATNGREDRWSWKPWAKAA